MVCNFKTRQFPRVLIKSILCLVFLFISGCGQDIRNLDSTGTQIVCFGNSVTYGTGAGKGEDYPAILSKLLQTDVINAGVPGDTTNTALLRLEKDVLAKDPYIVIIELGGNDFLQKMTKQKILKNMEQIISRIQSDKVMVAVCDISGGMPFPPYRRDYRKLSKDKGCIFIPGVLEGVLTDPSLKSDYTHPNTKGYRKIAEVIYQAIKPYLR